MSRALSVLVDSLAGLGEDVAHRRVLLDVIRHLKAPARGGAEALFSPELLEAGAGELLALLRFPDMVDAVYALLADEDSRALLDRVLRFRAVLPFIGLERAEPLCPKSMTFERYREAALAWAPEALRLGFDVPESTLIWKLGQYSLPGLCEVLPGDTVLDVGASVGDSALFFAARCAPGGAVYAFEALPRSVAKLAENARLAAAPVYVVPLAAWDEPCRLRISGEDAASSVIPGRGGAGGEVVQAGTIDAVVRERAIPRVDFIKMDIEGAELCALHGAETTLRAWRPRLALSVYHLPEDIYTIPLYLHSLDLGYALYLRHYTWGPGETVLYAVPPATP